MLFWNSLWKNDHAITYLAEKHLATAPRKTWGSAPRWVKILGLGFLATCGLLVLLTTSVIVMHEGTKGLLGVALLGLLLGLYATASWGIYRAWTLGALLSTLRQGGALPAFLHTKVSIENTVDVLAAGIFRTIVALVMLPLGIIVSFSLTSGPDQVPFWHLTAFLLPILAYFAVLGAFGLVLVHSGIGESAPKALGKGLLVCMASLYAPMLLEVMCAELFPEACGIMAALMAPYLLYLPFFYRKLAISWLKTEPYGQKRGALAGLLEGVGPVLLKWSGAFLSKRCADSNPILARYLSSQNLLLPLGLGLGLLALSHLLLIPLSEGLERNFVWFEVHIVTWFTAVFTALAAFVSSQWSVNRERQNGSLDLLRTTPLPARTVVDGWAVGAYWAYALMASCLMLWQLPGNWAALAFAVSLPVWAGYGGMLSGLQDTTGSWLCSGVSGVIFVSWVALPLAFMAGAVHTHAALAVLLVVATWLTRRRAILVYGS